MFKKKQVVTILLFCGISVCSLKYFNVPYSEIIPNKGDIKAVTSSFNSGIEAEPPITDTSSPTSADSTQSSQTASASSSSSQSNPAVTVSGMAYSSETVIVNQETSFSVTLTETNQKTSDRSFYTEVYSSRPFGDYLMGSATVALKSGVTSGKAAIKMKFDTPGDIYTIVKVYDKKGGTLITQKKSEVQRTIEYILKASAKLQGIDLADSLTAAQCKTIKSKGISFVVRYYSQNEAKCVTPKEAKAINGAGMQLVAVYQDHNASASKFTYDSGYADSKVAIKKAIEIGQPTTTPIYFAVDFEANSSTIKNVYNYFKGVKAGIDEFKKSDSKGRYWKIGGYGSYFVVQHLKDNNYISYVWQTAAWSYGNYYSYNIYQKTPNYQIAGAETDLNVSNVKKDNVVGGFYANN